MTMDMALPTVQHYQYKDPSYKNGYSLKRKPSPSVNEMKKNFNLDFEPSSSKKAKYPMPTLLSSPDVMKLKLASPDIESFLFGGNTPGALGSTPLTPNKCFFPKNVTQDQEAFVQGFTEKLEEIKNGGVSVSSCLTSGGVVITNNTPIKLEDRCGGETHFIELQPASSYNPVQVSGITTTTPSRNQLRVIPTSVQPITVGPVPTTVTIQSSSPSPQPHRMSWQNPNHILPLMTKEEECYSVPSPAMTVETTASSMTTGTPPLSPLDMDTQEALKLERKRARNRVAAMKCRQRKIDRIMVLEGKVGEMKSQNNDLHITAERLRDEVQHLRSEIQQHVQAGCHIPNQCI